MDGVFDQLGYFFVALDGYGDDSAGAGGYFLDVGEGLFVFEDAGGVVGVFGGDADYEEESSSMRALGPCFISPAG